MINSVAEKGFIPLIYLLLLLLVSAGVVEGTLYWQNARQSNSPQIKTVVSPSASTDSGGKFCTADTQCPQGYQCQVTTSEGTVCPVGIVDTRTGSFTPPTVTCQPTSKVIAGQCKLTAGGSCQSNNDCSSGLICHQNKCAAVVEGDCSPGDSSGCPQGYKCVPKCGPPVIRQGDEGKSFGYICEIEELANKLRNCPI